MSFINWGNDTPEQKEARRKYEEEQFHNMILKRMFEARGASSTGTAASASGSGSPILPSAILADGVCQFFVYWDPGFGDMVVSVANYTTLTLSDPTPLGVNSDQYYSYFEILQNKGILIAIYSSQPENTNRWSIFVDAGGNIVESVHTTEALDVYSTSDLDGNAVYVKYREVGSTSVTLYWWSGEKVGSKKISGVLDIWPGEFDDDTFADRTINFYSDGDVWLARPNGRFKNITNVVNDSGNFYTNSSMSCAHNNVVICFQDPQTDLYTFLRAINSNGEVIAELDISSYSMNYLIMREYGTDKSVCLGNSGEPNSNWFVCAFDGLTFKVTEVETYGDLPNFDIFVVRLGGYRRLAYSPEGAENCVLFFYNVSSWDDILTRFDNFQMVFLFEGASDFGSYSEFIELGETLGISYPTEHMSKVPTFYINSPGTAQLSKLVITPTTIGTTGLGINYSDVISVSSISILNNTLLRVQTVTGTQVSLVTEDGHTLSELDSTNFIALYYSNGSILATDDIDTWYSITDSAFTLLEGMTVSSVEFADFDWDNVSQSAEWALTDNQYSGTIYITHGDGSFALLTSNSYATLDAPIVFTTKRITKNHVYFLLQSTTWLVQIHDREGNVTTIDTEDDSVQVSLRVIGERVTFSSPEKTIIVFGNGTSQSQISGIQPNQYPNDFAYAVWC